HVRQVEGARSGRGPVAEMLAREAARTTARFYRTFTRLDSSERETDTTNEVARAAGARVDAHVCACIFLKRASANRANYGYAITRAASGFTPSLPASRTSATA